MKKNPLDPALQARCEKYLIEVQNHLRDELLPYWRSHGVDSEYGGFLTYYDRAGMPTGETIKTLVCQTRMIYTFASIHRAGLDDGKFLEWAQQGVEFLIDHFWDHDHGGWCWTAERDGAILDPSKIAYGQSFAMYALSEYGMASGDLRGMEWAAKTFETFQTFAADNRYGGYYEFFEKDWQKKAPGVYGGDRKSFDVHMHLMEAFTNLYEATGAPIYYDRTREVVGLLFDRIILTGRRSATFSSRTCGDPIATSKKTKDAPWTTRATVTTSNSRGYCVTPSTSSISI